MEAIFTSLVGTFTLTCFIIPLYVAGTFAVVSLMVGTVVEREPCSEYIRTDENRTALFETELECKIGIATAVTFLAAIFQVGKLGLCSQLDSIFKFGH